jgi:hypothetical protein
VSHLTPSDLIDLLDGTLPPQRAPHLDACAVCRKQVEDLRRTLDDVAEVQAPEPSPLFWSHFSGNVRRAIGSAAAGGPSSTWLHSHRVLATAVVAAIVAGGSVAWHTYRAPSPSTVSSTTAAGGSQSVAVADDPESAAAWARVRAAAEDMRWEDADDAGITANPGTADSAMLNLHDKEREALLAVLEEELKRSEED